MAKKETKQARALRECKAAMAKTRNKEEREWLQNQAKLIAFGAYG